MLLAALTTQKQWLAGNAIAALLGIVGTFLGTVDAWNRPPSWSRDWPDASLWPDAAWILAGGVLASATLWIALHTGERWWSVGLVTLALAQIAMVITPFVVSSLVASSRRPRLAAWRKLEETVLSGTAGTVLEQRCLDCGSGLRITYLLGESLVIHCTSCGSGTTRDGVAETPPWVEALGTRVETGRSG
jgi:hypothetical protein